MAKRDPYLFVDYKGLKVAYRENLSGGGMEFGQDFVPVTRKLFGKVDRVFELCAGPAFIGFSLLAEGLCDSLCLADVNPEAVAAMKETVRINGLAGKVSVHHSDVLDGIPSKEAWDLVVSNPPHFEAENQRVYERDIRAMDPRWTIHRRFYRDVHKFLKPHGSILMQENYMGSDESVFRPMLGRELRYMGSFMHQRPLERDDYERFYYFWVRRQHADLFWENEPATEIALPPFVGTPVPFRKKLKPFTKVRLAMTNATRRALTVVIAPKGHDMADPYLLLDRIVVPPRGGVTAPPTYYAPGSYEVVDYEEPSRRFGRLEVG